MLFCNSILTESEHFVAHFLSIQFTPLYGHYLPAVSMEQRTEYERMPLTVEAAAGIKCEQMLGQYKVIFER